MEAAGFKTWMDEEDMPSGSLLDGMATAVSDSAVVLACFSEGYKKSGPCRMEAEYALKIQKPILYVKAEKNYKPDGWLSFIMGQNMYYDVEKPGATDKLIKHIQKIYAGESAETVPESSRGPPAEVGPESASAADDPSQKLGISTPIKPERKESNWAKWTEGEVQEWLDDIGLDFLLEQFAFTFSLLLFFLILFAQHCYFSSHS